MPSFLPSRVVLIIGLALLLGHFPLSALSETPSKETPVEVTQTTDKGAVQPPARLGHFIRNAIPPKPETDRHRRQRQQREEKKAKNPHYFKNYIVHLEQKIRRNWHPPKDIKTKVTRVLMEIGQKGELCNVEIVQSSGNVASDTAALKALEKAAPFGPLPKQYTKNSVTIDFAFDYQVVVVGKHTDSKEKNEGEDVPDTHAIQNFDPSLFKSRPQL